MTIEEQLKSLKKYDRIRMERYEKAIRACLDTEPVTGLPWVQASPHEARRWLEAALLPDGSY